MDYDQEKIKQAFEKVKYDIHDLGTEISYLKNDLFNLTNTLNSINQDITLLKNTLQNLQKQQQIPQNTPKTAFSTHNQDFSTYPANSTDTSTHNIHLQAPKYPNIHTSIGNRGVSTDRQTDTRQTNNAQKILPIWTFSSKSQYLDQQPQEITNNENKPINQTINQASEILQDLDTLKKQIRLKFKQITNQEMLIFSTIYQLEEQFQKPTDYLTLSQKLNLSQSSIRDYVQRLIDKGIPIQKTKVNNKKITLSISKNLKKIATLSTILKLREI